MKLSFLLLPTLSIESVAGLDAFSLQETKNFARLAQVGYCDAQDVTDWKCVGCVDSNFQVVPGSVKVADGGMGNATQFMVARMANQPGCYVTFRGSKNLDNWIRNIEAVQVTPKAFPDCTGCKVHDGFYTVYENIYPTLRATLADIGCQIGSNDMLYVTGHSLGGAVATFAAYDLAVLGFKVSKVYTFESPRVGNQAFADAYNAKLAQTTNFRVTHDRDPVVHVPFASWHFEHVSNEIFFDADGGSYKTCNGGEDPSCADKYGDFVDDLLFHVAEHCSNDAFGKSFNFCGHDCQSSTTASVVI